MPGSGTQQQNVMSQIFMLCAIDRSAQSIECAVLLMNPSLVQPSIDCASINRSRYANDGWSCTKDHPWPLFDAYTVRHVSNGVSVFG